MVDILLGCLSAGYGLGLSVAGRGLTNLTGCDRPDTVDEIAEVEGLTGGLKTIRRRAVS
ncbi:hypothetical protein [Schaalia cardiffensis]